MRLFRLKSFLVLSVCLVLLQNPSPARADAPAKFNAYDFYVKAAQATTATEDEDMATILSDIASGRQPELARMRALLRKNAKALRLLRQGFSYPFRPPTNNTAGETMRKWRDLARLLVIEGRLKAARRDNGGALNSYLDAVRFGTDLPRGGALIPMLVGIACKAIGQRPIWKMLPQLDAGQARAGARRMEALMARPLSTADALQQDKKILRAELPNFIRQIKQSEDWPPGLTEQKFRENFDKAFDTLIANARVPYAAKKQLSRPDDPVTDAITQVLEPLGRAQFSETRSRANDALLATALALRWYRVEHGSYPQSLDALLPVYLKKLPGDGFALSGSLRYKLAGKNYLLYSVGPDGKDDGGKPIKNASIAKGTLASDGQQRIGLHQIRGDMVAGINR